LQNKVSRLRRIVGEETIETAVGGYRLRASAGQLDLLRFGDLVSAAAEAAADEDARAALEEAIGLWHGTPLANVGSASLQREVVPSLIDQYLTACEQWATVCLRMDRADAVAERFGPLAVAHPFRETLAGQLMLALHRTGRRAGALAAYERLRVALRDELGVDPVPEVQDLHVRMLRDEVVRNRAGPDEASPAQPSWAGRGPAPGPLIGRDTDLKMLAEAVRSHHAVTVVGPAGVGKTELALQTARGAAGRFPDGVVVAELGTLPARRTDDLEAMSAVLLAALSLPTPPAQSAWETLLQGLRPRELLLVLDNAEHVSIACSRLVDSIERSCPQVRVITTSRRPLGFGGERVSSLDPLDCAAAAELLRLRVSERSGDAALTANPDGVAGLCDLLDGLPLAIELAAARLGTMSPQSLITRMATRPDLLAVEGRPGLPHQRGLTATLRWSYDLLPGHGRLLLTRLAVFAGAFSLDDAERVCGFSPLAEGDVAALLSGLVDDSLAGTAAGNGDLLYRLLVPVREFALSAAEAGDLAATRAGHLRYLTATAEQLETAEAESRGALIGTLAERYPELIAALEWALHDEAPDPRAELGVRLLLAARPVWGRRHGAILVALEHAKSALARTATLPGELATSLMLLAGGWYFRAGDLDAAKPLLEQVRQLLGDENPAARRRRATALQGLAGIAYCRVEPGAADLLRQSAQDSRRTADPQTVAVQLSATAAMLAALGHLDEALSLVGEAGRAITGDGPVRRAYLGWRARVYLRADRVSQAMADIDEVLSDRAGIPSYELTESLLSRGFGLARQGHLGAARDTLNEGLRLAHEVHAFTLLPDLNQALAITEAAAGDLPKAGQHVRAVLRWALPLADIIDIIGALHITVVLAARQQNPRAAQIAAATRDLRKRSGLTTWPVTASEYAGCERALDIGEATIPAGPLHRGDVIRTAELALSQCLGDAGELAMAASR
jgi:predicted ATPase